MKKSILISHTICFLTYVLFTIAILGEKGSLTPQIATLSLGKPFIILGIMTMFTSYLSLSIALKDTFTSDYNISKKKSWLITIITPLFLYILLALTKQDSFTKVLSIGGIISGGLAATLILIMVSKAKLQGKRKPEYSMYYNDWFAYILILIFILAAVLEIVK